MLSRIHTAELVAVVAAIALAVPANAGVGFYSPAGIPAEVVRNMQFDMFNGRSATQVARNLSKVRGTSFKVFINLGPIVTESANPADLNMTYTTSNGGIGTKIFRPNKRTKLRVFPSDAELRRRLNPVIKVLAKYSQNVQAVFLADEPYLNGISKAELERAGKVVRHELDVHGIQQVKLGVIFAAGMFNEAFAHLINRQAGAYVTAIDRYFSHGDPGHPKAFAAWVQEIKHNRLVTYDRAGNMYIGGGLPRGFNVFGFDFYLSTILLDKTYDRTLEWFAKHFPHSGCATFADQPVSKIRTHLSFFHAGTVRKGRRYRVDDRRLLDSIYKCRMTATTTMLRQAVGARNADLLLVSESSNNGVLEFDPSGRVESNQPASLVESRVLDEVKRAQAFYTSHRCIFEGLMYFPYNPSHDWSISLHIGGASTMPTVITSIYQFAANNATERRACSVKSAEN